MYIMNRRRSQFRPLPRNWPASVKSATLHVISLAQFALANVRGWAANCPNARIRLAAENERLKTELALRIEQERIKDARMSSIPPQQRPHYPPTERLAILELKAARNWSLAQTARAFLVTAATISTWMRRLDEDGPDALVQMQQPVNRFPDYVTYIVKRLKQLCPMMGKKKISETLARAGLHLGTPTMSRMQKQKLRYVPTPSDDTQSDKADRVVTAKYPGHLWHVDLTVVPTALGFWTTWFPLSLPQCWPFCHWLALVEDHFSRRVMGSAMFKSQPTSEQVRAFLGKTIAKAGAPPKHLVCDKGRQFWCKGFNAWCERRGIKPRFGTVGKHGSIAVIERLILSVKLMLRFFPIVPLRTDAFRRDVHAVVDWFNAHRPHTTLRGRTPNEVYEKRFPANRRPRYEPRTRWARGSPCAKPWALVRGSPGAMVELHIQFHQGHRQLPIITLKRAG
jgi:transposase InsO family protein/transposase-like protein